MKCCGIYYIKLIKMYRVCCKKNTVNNDLFKCQKN